MGGDELRVTTSNPGKTAPDAESRGGLRKLLEKSRGYRSGQRRGGGRLSRSSLCGRPTLREPETLLELEEKLAEREKHDPKRATVDKR